MSEGVADKQIEAYFSGWSYPPKPQSPWGDVSIKYTDGTWEEIYRTEEFVECTNPGHEAVLAKVMIEHHVGAPVSDEVVRKMLSIPGRGYRRMLPVWLTEDYEKCSQMEMMLV